MLVIDACSHINQAKGSRDFTKLRFQEVRGRSRSDGAHPLAIMSQERGLFLRACNRDAELLLLVHTQRRRCKAGQNAFDLLIADSFPFHIGLVIRRNVIGQELHRTDAIAPYRFQQTEIVRALRTHAFSHALADMRIVGQQVVEHSDHGLATISCLAQRQRQGNGKSGTPVQPTLIISETDGAAGLLVQSPDQTIVDEDVEGRMRLAPPHQKISSIFGAGRSDRASTTNSRSRAANRA